MPNQYTKDPRRTVKVLVRLTPDEHKRALELAKAYRIAVVDVLRRNLGTLPQM